MTDQPMGEPSRTETPRDELLRRIEAAIMNSDTHGEAETAIRSMLSSARITERHRDTDITTMGDQREQIRRHRFIVVEIPREAEPERIEGAWRG